jgi:hypothetical protein
MWTARKQYNRLLANLGPFGVSLFPNWQTFEETYGYVRPERVN